MSSSKTSNYQLNQWVKSDRVLMSEFNADNAKIDAALASKASASAVTSLSQTVSQGLALRNCRFVTGSYSGDGNYGPDHANTLNFPQKPVFVAIVSENTGISREFVAGQAAAFISSGGTSKFTITWSARSVSWYVHSASAPGIAPSHQMNAEGTYHYFAILEIE